MDKNIQIVQLREHDLNRGASKSHTPVFPITKASAIKGMSELLRDLNINGVTPISDISDVNSPEKGKIYYEESTDKYYVYNEAQSNFVELGAGPSVDPSDLMPTITQEASTQSGGNNIITFTFPNGDTTQVIIKNGTQGNSGYTGAVGELEVVNNLEDGGEEKALSAEMGKNLKIQSFVATGTFGDAHDKAKEHIDVQFPWFLEDVDDKGKAVKKMIWHVGNGTFVDAIGSEIDGQRNGVTIKSNGSGTINYRGRNNSSAPYAALSFGKGVTNFSFSEIAEAVKSADSSIDSAYDGSTFSDVTFDFDSADTVIDIDFGGQSFIGNRVDGLGTNHLLYPDSGARNRLTAIRRLDISSNDFQSIHGASFSNKDNVLEYIQLSGEFVNNMFSLCKFNTAIRVFDLKDVDISDITSLYGYFGADGDWGAITVDIRTWDTSDIENFAVFMLRRKNSTIIIGNFSTESASTTTNFFNITSGVTVVCTSDTPPDLSFDWITTHVSSIKIPNKTVTVDDNDVTVLSLYQNHVQNSGDEVGESGWSKYASIMTTYEEGEY